MSTTGQSAGAADATTSSSSQPLHGDIPGRCPTPVEMGQSGWNILHGAAAVYPYAPSDEQREAMRQFIHGFSYTYPCNWCAYHMRLYLQQHPPDVTNKLTVTRFFCELHNNVNEHLGKPQYACDTSTLLRRWHPGYPDKMGDKPSMEERVVAEQRRMAAEQAAAAAAATSASDTPNQASAAMHWRSGCNDATTATTAATVDASKGGGADTSASAHERRQWWSSLWSSARDNTTHTVAPSKSAAAAAAAAATVPAAAATSATVMKPASKIVDGETDIAKVLQRLKGCMVYCPEDEQGKK